MCKNFMKKIVKNVSKDILKTGEKFSIIVSEKTHYHWDVTSFQTLHPLPSFTVWQAKQHLLALSGSMLTLWPLSLWKTLHFFCAHWSPTFPQAPTALNSVSSTTVGHTDGPVPECGGWWLHQDIPVWCWSLPNGFKTVEWPLQERNFSFYRLGNQHTEWLGDLF